MDNITLKIDGYKFDFRASCIIKDIKHEKIILDSMRSIKSHEAYLTPGGRVSMMENSYEAVKREIFEELGINIDCKLVSIEEIIVDEEKLHVIDFVYYAEIEEIEKFDNYKTFKVFNISELDNIDLKPYSLQKFVTQDNYTNIVQHISYEQDKKHI